MLKPLQQELGKHQAEPGVRHNFAISNILKQPISGINLHEIVTKINIS